MNKTYNKENPQMLESVVYFIGILGFSSMVEESYKSGQGDRLLRKLNDTTKEDIGFIKSYNESFGSMKVLLIISLWVEKY